MAKFSKGQVVKTAKEIDEYGWKIPAGSKATIVNVYGNGWYDIEVDGKLVGHSVSDVILARNANFGFDIQVKDARGEFVFPRRFAFIKKELDRFGWDMTPAYRIDDVYSDGSVLLEKYGKVKGRDIVVKNSAINEKVRIGDAELRGATTATLDFAKDRRGDYILAGDEVIADAGDGIDTYEVLKVLPGNKVKIGGLGVEVATVDAKTVSVTRKHGILKRDGDTVVLKNAKWQINYFDGGYDFVDAPNQGDAKRKAADMEKKSGRGVRSVIVAENYPKPYKDFVIRSNSTNPVVANAIAWKARNALISRYNPGDIVLYERRSPAVHTSVDGFMPGFREKMKIRLVAKRSGGLWEAKDDGGNKIVVDEADFMGKARNAVYALGHKFEKGDDVAFKGNTSYKGKVVDAEVHGNRGTFYIVKWNDGKTYRVTESDLVKA